jgi:hypothetical protein
MAERTIYAPVMGQIEISPIAISNSGATMRHPHPL